MSASLLDTAHFQSEEAAHGHVEALQPAGLPAPGYWPPDAVALQNRLVIDYVAKTSVESYRPW